MPPPDGGPQSGPNQDAARCGSRASRQAASARISPPRGASRRSRRGSGERGLPRRTAQPSTLASDSLHRPSGLSDGNNPRRGLAARGFMPPPVIENLPLISSPRPRSRPRLCHPRIRGGQSGHNEDAAQCFSRARRGARRGRGAPRRSAPRPRVVCPDARRALAALAGHAANLPRGHRA